MGSLATFNNDYEGFFFSLNNIINSWIQWYLMFYSSAVTIFIGLNSPIFSQWKTHQSGAWVPSDKALAVFSKCLILFLS